MVRPVLSHPKLLYFLGRSYFVAPAEKSRVESPDSGSWSESEKLRVGSPESGSWSESEQHRPHCRLGPPEGTLDIGANALHAGSHAPQHVHEGVRQHGARLFHGKTDYRLLHPGERQVGVDERAIVWVGGMRRCAPYVPASKLELFLKRDVQRGDYPVAQTEAATYRVAQNNPVSEASPFVENHPKAGHYMYPLSTAA